MVEASDEPSLLGRIRSRLNVRKLSNSAQALEALPTTEEKSQSSRDAVPTLASTDSHDGKGSSTSPRSTSYDDAITPQPPPAPPPTNTQGDEKENPPIVAKDKPNIAIRFYRTVKEILTASIFNALLVFVPAAIATGALGINPIVVFSLCAVAIIPLAGLLSYATEVVASSLGDTIGALLNVTFGNAVELIIL